MKKSVYVLVCVMIVILLIVLGVFAYHNNGKNENKENATTLNEQKNNKKNEEMNLQVNEVVTNEIENSIENEIVQNVVENTISSETLGESPKTAEEKAIEIVKKDWGEGTNIEFSVDGMDESGNYIVAVRNSQTTQALAFYRVNITNQTFTKKEMN